MATTEEMFTSLPTVSSAQLTDIICAVQGYVSPSVLGLSVQEPLQQIYNLFQANIILFNSGNPNGFVAGTTYQFCWDTLDQDLFICTTSGTALTAVWTNVNSGSDIFQWTNVTGTSLVMSQNNGYVANNAGLVTLTLPAGSAFGTNISIVGTGAGGWLIAQSAGQQIHIGSASTTSGATGSVASTNQYDSINLVCTVANTTWVARGGPQGILTIA